MAPPTTRATASVKGSTCCNAILLNGNAVAQTAIVAFLVLDFICYFQLQFQIHSHQQITKNQMRYS